MSHQYGWYSDNGQKHWIGWEKSDERRKLTIGIACEQSLHLRDISRELTIRQRRRPWQRRWKIAPASFQTISRLSQVAQLLKRREVMLELKREFQKEMVEFIALPFPSSKKLKIWSFHVVVAQERQRSVQKSVMHVQSCCFANLILLLWSCRCRRRRSAEGDTEAGAPCSRVLARFASLAEIRKRACSQARPERCDIHDLGVAREF